MRVKSDACEKQEKEGRLADGVQEAEVHAYE